MTRRESVRVLIVFLALVLSVQLARDAYSWFAYQDEREQLRSLTAVLDTAGLDVVRTELRADSLRRGITEMDRELDRLREALKRYERRAVDGGIPASIYGEYRRELDRYNQRVALRNRRLTELEAVADRNREAARRYNRLVTDIRALATRMGEPYYQIPSPAELAAKHGLRPPSRPGGP